MILRRVACRRTRPGTRSQRLPELAFDHREIVLAGRDRLRAKLSYTNTGFALARRVHALRAALPVRGRARPRRLDDEPPARAAPARGARGDRRAPRSRTRRWAARLGLPLPLARARGHRPVRGAAPSSGPVEPVEPDLSCPSPSPSHSSLSPLPPSPLSPHPPPGPSAIAPRSADARSPKGSGRTAPHPASGIGS